MLTLLKRIGRAIVRDATERGPDAAIPAEAFYDTADVEALKRLERLIQSRQGRWRLLC